MKFKHLSIAPVALAVASLIGCNPAPTESSTPVPEAQVAEQSEAEKVTEFFDSVFQQTLQRSPIWQSYLGIKWDYDKWDTVSEQRNDEERQILLQNLATAQAFDSRLLSPQQQMSLRLFIINAQRQLANDDFRHHSYIMHQFRAAHTQVPSFLINIHRIASVDDAQAYIARLATVDLYFDGVIEQLKLREKIGVYPPKWSYDQMIQASQNVISGQPFSTEGDDSTILHDFKNKVAKLDIGQTEKDALIAEATTALTDVVKPAYQKLIDELAHQRVLSPQGDGVWRLPEGDKWYQNRLNWFTTTELTADEVHQLGLENVARIHEAMRNIMTQVGFTGTLPEFFEFMRNDPQFYYPNTEAGRQRYLTEAKAMIDTMEAALPDYFGLKPKAPMIVKRVEAFREKSAGKAFYQSPAQDGSRPGTYYANLYDMNSMPTYQMEALAYHEGIPGHHMQRAISQELEGIPQFQKFLSFTAYSEGWGLYTEELGKDMGFYDDPYSDFGRLAMELWRACRLVVDTGIHAKQWSREKAIQYLIDNTPNPAYDAEKAIERYIAMPGQATAYMIGKLKIMELRRQAQQELGDKFNYAGFHDEILKDGPVPLSVLEEKVNHWIKITKSN